MAAPDPDCWFAPQGQGCVYLSRCEGAYLIYVGKLSMAMVGGHRPVRRYGVLPWAVVPLPIRSAAEITAARDTI